MLRSLAASSLVLALTVACTPVESCDDDCPDPNTNSNSGPLDTGTESGPGETETGTDTEPELGACAVDEPIVVLETNLGTMVVQLDRVRAPVTVENFVAYVAAGFYDGTIFHRVIDNFVIQGGGFEPGPVLKDTMGPIPREIHPELRHVDGAIAMARNVEPDTAESQFYITDGAQPGLDDSYAVFGVLIDGFPVRNAISGVDTHTVDWMGFPLEDVPVEDVVVEQAYCVEALP